MTSPCILIAGIGNIFLGDDAFGPEVLRRLLEFDLPENVRAVDFGIRGYDLAYAIANPRELTLLVDAAPRGDPPGTLYLMELDLDNLEAAAESINAHSLNPVAALQFTRSLGFESHGRYFLIGCEPASLECEDGQMGLSAPVAAAVPAALEMIRKVLRDQANIELNLKPTSGRNSHAFHS